MLFRSDRLSCWVDSFYGFDDPIFRSTWSAQSATVRAIFLFCCSKEFDSCGSSNANQNGLDFVNILIISVTLIVVAVPEGLPLVNNNIFCILMQ